MERGDGPIRRASTETWRRQLLDRQLPAEIASFWSGFARPNIRLLAQSPLGEDISPAGASKLGGLPDLPAGMAWPVRPAYGYPRQDRDYIERSAWEPQPLSFLAQINLADVAQQRCDLPLPDAGHLLFFYDMEVQPWGFDPQDGVGARVVYVPKGAQLARGSGGPPDPAPARLLRCEAGECLPSWVWLLFRLDGQAGFSPDDFRKEIEKLGDAEEKQLLPYGGHALGGWPDIVQNPMELECELVTNGIYCGDPEGYADPRAAALRQSAEEWRLLLQLDSEDDLWMWGDSGKLYFWCREQDLAARRFDRCWTVLQCC